MSVDNTLDPDDIPRSPEEMRMTLVSLTRAQLLHIYNRVATRLGLPMLKTFRDHNTAVSRAEGVLRRADNSTKERTVEGTVMMEPEAQETPMVEEVAVKRKGGRKKGTRVKGRFNLPLQSEVRSIRPGTLRYQAAELLKSGATFEQIEDLVRNFDDEREKTSETVSRRAYEVVRLLHTFIGYGLREDDNGVITLVTE